MILVSSGYELRGEVFAGLTSFFKRLGGCARGCKSKGSKLGLGFEAKGLEQGLLGVWEEMKDSKEPCVKTISVKPKS